MIGRALALGLGFGLAVAIVDSGFAGIGAIERRFGTGAQAAFTQAALEIALALVLALVASPLLRVRARSALTTFAFLAVLALAWLGLGKLAELDAPIGEKMVFGPPAGALVLCLLGLGLARLRRWLPWALGGALFVAAALGPTAYIEATSAAPAPAAALPPAREGAPDVVLIVLDTVRAGSLGAYGYRRATSSEIERLAREGVLFADATSPSTWSLPSHASLFTGRYPSSHGAHGESVALDDRYPTLAQVLAARGYETFCFTSNAWISDGLGLTRGFGWQDATWREGGAGRNFSFIYRLLDRMGVLGGDKGGAKVAEHFAQWRAARDRDARPSFVFLNFIEAHFPYHQLPSEYLHAFTDEPGSELRDVSMALMGQQFGGPGTDSPLVDSMARDMYDGGVFYSDVLLGRIVEAIRARGALDDTILVVMADHGEILGEKGGFYGHGPSLYQQVISVPLVIRYPPAVPAGVTVETPVSTLGVFATILDLAGIEAPPTLQVGSLLPLVRGSAASPGPVLSERMKATALAGEEMDLGDPQMRGDVRYRALRSGDWKLVETSEGEHFLYDLAGDPGERHDLASERPRELARMRSELETARLALELPELDADLASKAMPELDSETQERLRELGYVE